MPEARRRVRPFPFAELPRLLHSQVAGLATLAQHLFPLLHADPADAAALAARLERLGGGSFAIAGYETYLLAATPQELSGRALGALGVALERVGPASLRAALLVDETLCQRLGLSAGPALATALRGALAGLPLRVGRPLQAGELPAQLFAGAGPTVFCVDAALRTSAGGGWVRLLCEGQVRLRAPRSSGGPWLDQRQRLDAVPVTLALTAGHGALPLAEVLALAVGDILLLDHFGPRPVVGGPVTLRVGAGAFPAHLDGNGLTIMGPFATPHRPGGTVRDPSQKKPDEAPPDVPSEAPDAQSKDPGGALLREIPVGITCEIGRVTLSAKEVLELRPGAVLPVGRPLAGPVDLRAGERLIARGELVDIEGELGVRLTELVE